VIEGIPKIKERELAQEDLEVKRHDDQLLERLRRSKKMREETTVMAEGALEVPPPEMIQDPQQFASATKMENVHSATPQ